MMKKKFVSVVVCSLALLFGAGFAGCDAAQGGWVPAPGEGLAFDADGEAGNYRYPDVEEQKFYDAEKQPSSYFSLDRNTAGYSLMRAQINAGDRISASSVRIEELVNYFSYEYPAPAEGEGLKATAYLSECPWNEGHNLITVGLKSEERVLAEGKNNYVFLIDVSGSMSARVKGLEGQTCLDLVKYGIGKLTDGLGANDAVSVVKYASGEETVLEPTLATEEGKAQIKRAVNGLTAYGATNGSGGLELAYRNAEKYFSDEGNNRVILMTDGDFNVGIRNETELKEFIQEKARKGVYLSVLGVGMGNMRDDFMQTLALNGNGNYAYIDTPREAEKVLCEELGGLLSVVAKDAKAGVTFSGDAVVKYRLIGYDMKMLSEDDFENAEKDAGEIGSNLCVTALYEAELSESVQAGAPLAEVCVRFKSTSGKEKEISVSVEHALTETDDLAFISCVAEFGLILRNSAYKGDADLSSVLSRLNDLTPYLEEDVYKAEFRQLVEKARRSGYYEA